MADTRAPKGGYVRAILLSLAGAALFWIPNVIGHAFEGRSDVGPLAWLTAGVAPAILGVIAHLGLRLLLPKGKSEAVADGVMLLAIWITGPAFMMVSASFTGGGYRQPGALKSLLLMTGLFPIATFSMSAYCMALGALGFITFYLLFFLARDLAAPKNP